MTKFISFYQVLEAISKPYFIIRNLFSNFFNSEKPEDENFKNLDRNQNSQEY